MPYSKAKVYNDGSHYIAIPHTERPYTVRVKPKEDVILVPDDTPSVTETDTPTEVEKVVPSAERADETEKQAIIDQPKEKKVRQTTKKKLFDELYKKNYGEKSNFASETFLKNGASSRIRIFFRVLQSFKIFKSQKIYLNSS